MVTLQEVQFMPPIYLDHAGTTPLDRRVREAMEPYLTDVFGNPSSIHRQGQQARMAVDGSRETVAWMLGAAATEIVFTGGGTEADNAAIYGVAWANRDRGRHIVTSAIEHEAVLEASAYLESQHDFEVSRVMPGSEGIVSVADIEAALRPDTVLVSVMYANNEIGTIQPVGDIGLLCRSRGVLFHVDAVQAVGTIPVDVGRDTIDLLSLSAHKFYGPKAWVRCTCGRVSTGGPLSWGAGRSEDAVPAPRTWRESSGWSRRCPSPASRWTRRRRGSSSCATI